jgi:chemotaxis family two-component system response regulator Rcp1
LDLSAPNAPHNQRPSLVLLIENDENDVFLFRRALSKLNWKGDLRIVGSVSEGRSYMENSFPFDDQSYFRCPDLIVTDYRLNAHTALDFITWLRNNPHCADIPIIILTGAGSGIPPDVLSKLAVTGYIVKTPDVNRLSDVLREYLVGLRSIA